MKILPTLLSSFGSLAPIFLVSGLAASPAYSNVAIQSAHSYKCMDVRYGSVYQGEVIQQYRCNNSGAQRFIFRDVGHGYALIINAKSGMCIDVDAWSTAPGGRIIQWPCHGGDNQKFKRIHTRRGTDLLQNRHSGLCLDVDAWSYDDWAPIIQWHCHGGRNQQWTYYPN